MAKLTFNTDYCKGCGLCVEACPLDLLTIETKKFNQKGYNYVVLKDQDSCTGCVTCAKMCPDCVIKVER